MSDQLAVAVLALASAVVVAPGRCGPRARLAAITVGTRAGAASGRLTSVLPVLLGVSVGLLAAVVVGGGVSAMAAGLVVGTLTAVGARRMLRPTAGSGSIDPMQLAGAWDLLAAGLRCGLPVSAAVKAVADQVSGTDGMVLRQVAELLVLGADPTTAWRPALTNSATAGLATAAIHTARSGAAMAGAIGELADGLRAVAIDQSEARAQRAGVLITGPLGLCFLPAFFCLGVLPVVIGLAQQTLNRW